MQTQRNYASAWENHIFGSLIQKSGSFTAMWGQEQAQQE